MKTAYSESTVARVVLPPVPLVSLWPVCLCWPDCAMTQRHERFTTRRGCLPRRCRFARTAPSSRCPTRPTPTEPGTRTRPRATVATLVRPMDKVRLQSLSLPTLSDVQHVSPNKKYLYFGRGSKPHCIASPQIDFFNVYL